MISHGLSFDLEDWHQLVARRIGVPHGAPWRHFDECVETLLSVCDELGCKATFFVLGLLANARPSLIRRIADAGHEIASHSLQHTLVRSMSREAILDDLRRSKQLLEDLSGTPVVGYRAPEFSVGSLASPCFELLLEAGFTYDSSVFPVRGIRYGIHEAPHVPFQLLTQHGRLSVFPLATTRVGSWRLPIAGGSHFRLVPPGLVTAAARRASEAGESFVFYFHPYEFTRRLLYLQGGLRVNCKISKLLLLHNFNNRGVVRTLQRLGRGVALGPVRDLKPGVIEVSV